MSFHYAATLTDYARIAVDLRIRMAETTSGVVDHAFLREMFASQLLPSIHEAGNKPSTVVDRVVDAVARAAHAAWSQGETFVLAPAITAIIAAAAEALDLTGAGAT